MRPADFRSMKRRPANHKSRRNRRAGGRGSGNRSRETMEPKQTLAKTIAARPFAKTRKRRERERERERERKSEIWKQKRKRSRLRFDSIFSANEIDRGLCVAVEVKENKCHENDGFLRKFRQSPTVKRPPVPGHLSRCARKRHRNVLERRISGTEPSSNEGKRPTLQGSVWKCSTHWGIKVVFFFVKEIRK